jgi:hypothetical protein
MTGGGGGYESEDLPASVGANEVGGKTTSSMSSYGRRIEFLAAADGASSGVYKILESVGIEEYQEIKIGVYSWNETTRHITLKPERAAAAQYDGSGYGALEDKADYRVSQLAILNNMKEQLGEEWVNKYLSSTGFSSDDAYLDYMTAEQFANKTYNYDFSTDGGAALFLYEVLPVNKGSNELAGQIYNGIRFYINKDFIKDPNDIYTFTDYAYTHTNAELPGNNSSGLYAYDSARKWVWLAPSSRSSGYDLEQYRYNTTDKSVARIW